MVCYPKQARPQLSPVPSMSTVSGSVTCGAIEAQILSQTPLSVANSCTEKIRAVRVCNTLVVHHECKRNLHCSRPTTVAYDFSCLKPNLSCGFPISCCDTNRSRQSPRKWLFCSLLWIKLGKIWVTRTIICYNMVEKKINVRCMKFRFNAKCENLFRPIIQCK